MGCGTWSCLTGGSETIEKICGCRKEGREGCEMEADIYISRESFPL